MIGVHAYAVAAVCTAVSAAYSRCLIMVHHAAKRTQYDIILLHIYTYTEHTQVARPPTL